MVLIVRIAIPVGGQMEDELMRSKLSLANRGRRESSELARI